MPNSPTSLPTRDIESHTLPLIHDLIRQWGGDPEAFNGRLIAQLIQTSLKLIPDGHDTGQVKLLTSALKEMRYERPATILLLVRLGATARFSRRLTSRESPR